MSGILSKVGKTINPQGFSGGDLLKGALDPGGAFGKHGIVDTPSSPKTPKNKPKPVKKPKIPEPTVMPLPDDDAARKARQRSLLAQQKRSGRASTILSTEDKLG